MFYNLKGTTKNFLHIGGPSKSAIRTGTGVPSGALGIDSDLFISQDDQELYIKRSGSWFNITDSDLITIAGLSHTSGNVIRSNGAIWQSTTLSLNDLGDAIITTPATNQLLQYNGTNWVNTTTAISNVTAETITGADSVTSEEMLFLVDSTRSNKKLSITETDFVFAKNGGVGSNDFIPADASIGAAGSGYILPYPGTIIRMTAHTNNSNGNNKDISLYLDATENTAVVNLGGAGSTEKEAYNTAVNIDFAAGEKLRAQAKAGSGGNINDVVINVWIKWRK